MTTRLCIALLLTLAATGCSRGSVPSESRGAPAEIQQTASPSNVLKGAFEPATDARFATTAGTTIPGSGIKSDGRPGVLVFGPYLTLPAGKHRVEFYGHGDDLGGGYLAFEVTSRKGKMALNSAPFKAGPNDLISVVEFTSESDLQDVETRVITNGKFDVTISKIVVH